jgi:hypothetical protein
LKAKSSERRIKIAALRFAIRKKFRAARFWRECCRRTQASSTAADSLSTVSINPEAPGRMFLVGTRCAPDHRVSCGRRVLPAFEGQNVTRIEPSMRTDHVIGNLLFFQKLDKELTGDGKQLRRFYRCQLCIALKNRDGFARLSNPLRPGIRRALDSSAGVAFFHQALRASPPPPQSWCIDRGCPSGPALKSRPPPMRKSRRTLGFVRCRSEAQAY